MIPLLQRLLVTALAFTLSTAAAQSPATRCALLPYQPCGAGELLCRCNSNLYEHLTNVQIPPGTREYLNARLLEIGNALAHKWQPGDILFVGDSLTDIGRLDFDPLLPRAHNLGILGAKIDDVNYTLDLFEAFFPAPSKVVVLIGTNNLRPDDVSLPSFNQSEFAILMDRLQQFQTQHQCQVIVRSIPPGEPDPAPSIPTAEYHTAFNNAVIQANAYLAQASSSRGFTFANEHPFYWNTATGRIDHHMYIAQRYTPCAHADYLHLGCLGYMISSLNLASHLYPSLPLSGNFTQLSTAPSAPPQSGRPGFRGAGHYRYASVTIPPGHLYALTVHGSSYHYVSITDPLVRLFTPHFPYGYPSVESETTNGSGATVLFRNFLEFPQTIIVCIGSSPAQPATWSANLLPIVN